MRQVQKPLTEDDGEFYEQLVVEFFIPFHRSWTAEEVEEGKVN